MRKRIFLLLTFVLMFFLFNGCGIPVPNENQIKSDLVGKKVYYRGNALVGRSFKPSVDNIESVKVARRLTDRKAKTDEVFIDVVFLVQWRGKKHLEKMSGQLKLKYRLYDKGWFLENVGNVGETSPRKNNFIIEKIK